MYYSQPTWEGGLASDKQLWIGEKVDICKPSKKAQKNFWRRGEATKNTSCPREGGNMRGWEGVERNGRDCNGFRWSQENAEHGVVRGDEGNISWGPQGGYPGNNDEEVMVHIIL